MDSYSFYKSLYDRELNKRYTLDSAINLPLTVFTILVASNSYLLKDQNVIYNCKDLEPKHFILALIIISLLVCAFYLVSSFNNLYRGFSYSFIGYATELRKYEIDIKLYNESMENKLPSFEDTIIDKLAQFIDNHMKINDKRSLHLYYAKTALIIALCLTIVNFIIESFKYIQL